MSNEPRLCTLRPWVAWFAALLFGAMQAAFAAVPAQEPRHALVVGNAGYASAPLLNSVNDATAVAKVLEKAGFTVDLKINATQKQLQDADGVLQLLLRGVDFQVHREAGFFQHLGHGRGVIDRIQQRGAGVAGVADDERMTRFLGRHCGEGCLHRTEQQRAKPDHPGP